MEQDKLNWNVHSVVRKYSREELGAAGLLNASIEEIEAAMEPTETTELAGNLLLNEGIGRLLNLLIGGGGTPYNNANAQLGVGSSAAAANATQTNLLGGASTAWTAMDSGFPSISGSTVTFKGTFGDGVANFAWNEWSIRNGAAADENLNRKAGALGTKSGGVWSLTTSITIT